MINRAVLFVAIAPIIILAGCTTIGRLPLVEQVESRFQHFAPPVQLQSHVDVEKLAGCMAPLSARLKSGYTLLIDELKEDSNGQLLFGQIDEPIQEPWFGKAPQLHPLLEQLFNKLVDNIRIASVADPTGSLFSKRTADIAQHIAADKRYVEKDGIAVTKRTKMYLKAYSKKGASQLVDNDALDNADIAKLKEVIAPLINRNAEDPAIANILNVLEPQLKKLSGKTLDNAPGFIGRDGTQYGFPGVVADGKSVTIDHKQIGADAIRIILEALRDTYAPLPAIGGSTATIPIDSVPFVDRLDFSGDPLAAITVPWHLDHHDSSKILKINITEDQFQDIEAKARKAESSVAGAVGKAIRGGSWGSLNNEAVATFIETFAGVLARHTTERAGWCLQAQQPNPQANLK
jgi:hypothetical protein